MARSKEKLKAKELRQKGKSIKEISQILNVSKSSTSMWCRDIKLTPEQIKTLHDKMIKGSYAGRMKGARIQKERKERIINYYTEKGLRDIKRLNKREFFIAGLTLYWGEGSKKSPGVKLCNSDPLIIKFMMRWFREILNIQDDRFLMYVTINKIHKQRLGKVIKYWSKITDVPIQQFRKPILIKAKNKKTYENFNEHYGTLCIRIAKSTDLYYKILGWLNALGRIS